MKSNKIKTAISVVLFSVVIIMVSSCEEDSPVANYADDEAINDNVVLMDSTDVTLKSSDQQLSEGIYIFVYAGTAPEFKTGDVIVGHTGYGYLRKVISSQTSGNTVTLETDQATLNDLYDDVQLSVDLPYSSGTKSTSNSFSNDEISLSLNDYTFYSDDNLEIKLESSSVTIDPELKFTFEKEDGTISNVSLITNNTSFEFDYQLAVSGTVSELLSVEKILLDRNTKVYSTIDNNTYPVGYVNHVVKLVLTNTTDVGMDYSYHSITKYNFDLGFTYSEGVVNNLFEKNSEATSVANSALEVSVEGSVRLSIVYIPTYYPFAVKGPYLINELYSTATGRINQSSDWNLGLDVAMETTAGIDFSVINNALADKEATDKWFEDNLYTAPDSAYIVSGNNQTGSPDTELAEVIRIKVLDNLDLGLPKVKVYFEPETDNGTVEEAYVFTDDNGYAETNWTLGETSGEQELKVLVKKGSGSNVKTLTFNATAEDLDGVFIDPRDGQGYQIVTIGTQTWFAENMNYETDDSWFYENSTSNGEKYGRLYNQETAKVACPDGWHLPSKSEWTTLINYLGGEDDTALVAKLKSTEGWDDDYNGTNESGFNALPGGAYFYNDGSIDMDGDGVIDSNDSSSFDFKGVFAYFWSSTSGWEYQIGSNYIQGSNSYSITGNSVRCIKD